MTETQVDRFEKVEAQLSGLYEEVQSLAKKSPDGGMNGFKLRHVNTVLETANEVLPKGARPFGDFVKFDQDDVPTNSDVLLILRQYANCLEEVRAANIEEGYNKKWFWIIGGKTSDRRARPPAKLGR